MCVAGKWRDREAMVRQAVYKITEDNVSIFFTL